MVKKILISVNEDILIKFDEITGLVPRSAYINDLMKREVERRRV